MSNPKPTQQTVSKRMFTDYYDEKLIKLGGERFINERNKKLPLSTQLNMLTSCGFKVPNHGLVIDHHKRLCSKNSISRAIRDSLIVIKRGDGSVIKESCRKAVNNPLLKEHYASDFIPAINDGMITRYLIIMGNLFSFTMAIKEDFKDAYWATGSQSLPESIIEYSELVTEDLSDRRIKEFINKFGAFYPTASIDIIEAVDSQQYAVNLDTGPILKGTPLQDIAPAEQMAKLLADNLPNYM